MDRFHDCFSSIDCKIRVVKIKFLNEHVLELIGGNSVPRGRIISCLKVCKMISRGCLYNIVRVKYLDFEVPPIESVPVVREFQEVFPVVFPVLLLNKKLILVLTFYRIQIPFKFLLIRWLQPN